MTLPCGMDHITCFRAGVGEYVCGGGCGGGGGGLLYVKRGLLSTGLSKHLARPYSDSGIRSTCHRDKGRPQAR